jgi:hypothetical protein
MLLTNRITVMRNKINHSIIFSLYHKMVLA